MGTPQEKIEIDLKTAMKAREADKVATLRMLLAQLKNQRIAEGAEVDEPGFIQIVRKLIKQREDAAELYIKGGRTELADKETHEIGFLASYLPEEISEADLRTAVAELIASEGLSGPAAIGKVMKTLSQRFEGRADNRLLSSIARELLSA